jgi:FAD dependent oxidoreductase
MTQIVIGGGLVDSAIAYGLAHAGLAAALSTKAMSRFAPRAAISASSGCRARATARCIITAGRGTRRMNGRRSPPSFWQRPGSRSGMSVRGLHLCLGEAELDDRRQRMERMRAKSGNFGFEYRMLDHHEVAEMLPGIGPAVTGASYTRYDGHANSLNLLHALHKGFVENGGRYFPNSAVTEAAVAPGGFRVHIAGDEIGAPRVVLAAGLGNAALETTLLENCREATQRLWNRWSGRRPLMKGLGLLVAVRRVGIPIRRGVRGLQAIGRNSLEHIAWEGGKTAADHLLLHEGVIPNVQGSLALRLRHDWDEEQLSWRPALDA